MKYKKLISQCFNRKSSNGYVAVAVVAGLAAGAIFSILFAPESGSDTRKIISDRAKGLGSDLRDKYTSLKNKITGNEVNKVVNESQVPNFVHKVTKKRKSDIRDLIDESHHSEQPDES